MRDPRDRSRLCPGRAHMADARARGAGGSKAATTPARARPRRPADTPSASDVVAESAGNARIPPLALQPFLIEAHRRRRGRADAGEGYALAAPPSIRVEDATGSAIGAKVRWSGSVLSELR